jgi:hypothetical protein
MINKIYALTPSMGNVSTKINPTLSLITHSLVKLNFFYNY